MSAFDPQSDITLAESSWIYLQNANLPAMAELGNLSNGTGSCYETHDLAILLRQP